MGDFGKLGSAYVETEPIITEADVILNLLTGQYDASLEIMAVSAS